MSFRVLVVAPCTVALALSSCMRVTDGIEIDVAYRPAPTPAEIRTDLGYRVALDRAMLVLSRVELIRCDEEVVVDLWGLFTASRARAHTLDTPTRLGVPLVIDLMEATGGLEFVGTLKPPPGRYCGIRVSGSPADADAVGLDDDTLEMTRHSALILGRVRDDDRSQEQALVAAIAKVFELPLDLERPLVFDRPIVETISIRIDHTTWFDGIDFALLPEEAVREHITENIKSSLVAELPDSTRTDGFEIGQQGL